MAQMRCTLCSCEMETAEFNLQKSCSTYSKTPLLTLLQTCVGEMQIPTMKYNEICTVCYLLLNELDCIKLRTKAIEDRLKNYLDKHLDNVALPKSDEADFKSNVKLENPDLNDDTESFEFDEINFISDINPSLDGDINELNSNAADDSNCDIEKPTKKDANNPRRYECTECPKTWKTMAELKSHISTHSKERPYICEICGQAYKRQQALDIHVGMHNGIYPFTCVYCNKSFTQKGALVRHIPIHTGELPFQCDLCGKRFVHHTSFNMHKLSHSGQKSFKCDVCGLGLMSGSHLKRHMRVHTGEKKYSCGTCGKKFAERYNLAVHEKLHLGLSKKKKYQCHLCDNFYNRQVKLDDHLLIAHQSQRRENPAM